MRRSGRKITFSNAVLKQKKSFSASAERPAEKDFFALSEFGEIFQK